jgi:toluene monooxygenase system protein E
VNKAPPSTRPGLKTWSALAGARQRPNEHEVLTNQLHARTRNPAAAYEQSPDSSMNQWYQQHVVGSPLQHGDWDSFRDPDQLTYRAYTTMQDGQEAYVDGLLDDHANNAHDAKLTPAWVATLSALYTPGRYLMAISQMISAYLVQTAPASTITNCAAFQEADQLRWLSRIAYRTRELANSYPSVGFGELERASFERAAEWQGFRRLLENAMVAYDWGECFFAFNVVAARAIDAAYLRELGASSRLHQDTLTAMLIDNQLKDSARSCRWTAALVKHCLTVPENAAVIAQWLEKWVPLANSAIDSFCTALPDSARAAQSAKENCRTFWHDLGLGGLPSIVEA